MSSGRKYGLALATGVTSGSLLWSVSAAFGLGAIMLANAWAFEILRYFGASYLLFLAYKSMRSALKPSSLKMSGVPIHSYKTAFFKGFALHLTNPKAVLFFGSLYSIGIPPNAQPDTLALVIGAIGLQSFLLFHGYALLFSSPSITAGYAKLRRWFEGVFSLAFGAAGLKILMSPLDR